MLGKPQKNKYKKLILGTNARLHRIFRETWSVLDIIMMLFQVKLYKKSGNEDPNSDYETGILTDIKPDPCSNLGIKELAVPLCKFISKA